MYKAQFEKYIIRPVLFHMEAYIKRAERGLVMIAAHESRRGYYLHQTGSGPAVGIFQMEPFTHDAIIDYMRKRRPDLLEKLMHWTPRIDAKLMAGNHYYAAFMARVFFMRFPEVFPESVEDMAVYAKWRWNTVEGKATPADYLEAFRRWK